MSPAQIFYSRHGIWKGNPRSHTSKNHLNCPNCCSVSFRNKVASPMVLMVATWLQILFCWTLHVQNPSCQVKSRKKWLQPIGERVELGSGNMRFFTFFSSRCVMNYVLTKTIYIQYYQFFCCTLVNALAEPKQDKCIEVWWCLESWMMFEAARLLVYKYDIKTSAQKGT